MSRPSDEVQQKRPEGLPKGSPSVHLDALRGLAALCVLVAHWRDAFFVDYPAVPHHTPVMSFAYLVTGLGHQWVIVFFVMSGYLVGGSVVRAVKADRWSWRSYLLARLTRLYVVLLPALLLGGAIDWMGMHLRGSEAIYSGQSAMHVVTANVHTTLTLPSFLGNCLFLQTISLPYLGWGTVPIFGSNGPLWSLANEFWYYMAFPLLVFLVAKGRGWWLRLVCCIGLLVWIWFVGAKIAWLGLPWLMGVVLLFLPPLRVRRSWMRGLAIISAIALLCGGLALGKAMDSLTSNLILGAIVTFLIWVMLHCATAPLPELYTRIAQRAARSSYTLYLVHLPMLVFLKTLFHLPRVVLGWHPLAIALGVLALILFYAQVVYELFEKNTDAFRKRITQLIPRSTAARPKVAHRSAVEEHG